LRAALARLN